MFALNSLAGVRRRSKRTLARFYPLSARPAMPWEAHRATEDYGLPAEPDWREVDWPSLVRRATVAGREITYVDLGEGEQPPIVFVHGLGGNWQNWLENLPHAAQSRRTIAMDLPGFGASAMPAEEISISLYARLIDELLEQLGIESAVIVGNSMGGFIAAELAIQYAARVERLVLVSAAGISIHNLQHRTTITSFRIGTVVSAATLARRRDVVARPRLRHLVMATVIRHPQQIRPDLLLEVMPGANAPGFMPSLEALTSYDFRDSLSDIACPTLLIWGREDVLVPAADADEFERLIPNSRKVLFDETGHVAMLERPREFNRCLSEFLTEEFQEPVDTEARTAPSLSR